MEGTCKANVRPGVSFVSTNALKMSFNRGVESLVSVEVRWRYGGGKIEIKKRHQVASTTCVQPWLLMSGQALLLFHFIVDPVPFSLKLISTPHWPS